MSSRYINSRDSGRGLGQLKIDRLKELEIDRSAEGPSGTRRLRVWIIVGAVILGGVGLVTLTQQLMTESSSEGLVSTETPSQTDPPIPQSTSTPQTSQPKRPAAVSTVLDATGYVIARRKATVSANATGRIVEVLIEEGMQVEEGQLLAQLDDRIPRRQLELEQGKLEAARRDLAEPAVRHRQAEAALKRKRELARQDFVSEEALEIAELEVDTLAAQLGRLNQEIAIAQSRVDVRTEALADMQVHAPFAGVVVSKSAQPGEIVSPISAGGGFTRTGICTIVDMSSLEVEVDVNESFINRVTPEQRVLITLNAYPQERFEGRVIAIIPTADRNKATVRIRVGFVEKDDRILPDMGVRVAFQKELAPLDTEVN